MSHLGRVPPRRPDRPAASGGCAPDRPMLLLVADVLAREVIVGTVIWGCRTTDPGMAAAFNVTLLGLIVLGTRWFGLMRPRAWGKTVSEALLVFIGGVCVANLLTFLFGASPLLAAGP